MPMARSSSGHCATCWPSASPPPRRTPRICLITLDRPERRNAVNDLLAAQLSAAVSQFERDPAFRVAILRASGPVFCAGMDLAALNAGERAGLEKPDGFALFVRRPRTKPVIAAVQGGAHGGGFEIVLACDLVIAAEGAVFSLPEVRRGLIAAGGGAIRVSSRLPAAIASELLLTGRPIDAERAAELGLINAAVPGETLDARAIGMALEIIPNAPLSLAGTKAVIDAAIERGEHEAWQVNRRAFDMVLSSEDSREGARAFTERREPVWHGR